ncbi:MAG: hypothetical protein R6V06_06555 [Kiritimatiellia bacterium]
MSPPYLIDGPETREDLISSIDISATVLNLAGIEKDKRIQGVSFAPILSNHTTITREIAFAEHNWHIYRNHERMVQSNEWLYIKNNLPDKQNLCVEAYIEGAGEELWEAHKNGKLTDSQMNVFLDPCASEELYHIRKDPAQLTNVASAPENGPLLHSMRKLLKQWTEQTGDNIPENLSPDRDAPPGKPPKDRKLFKYGEMPGEATRAAKINKAGSVWL